MPFYLLTHNALLGTLKELDDVLDLRTVGHLVFDLLDHIEDARLSVEQQTVGIGDMLLHLLVDAGIVHHRGVGASVCQGLSTNHDKGLVIL